MGLGPLRTVDLFAAREKAEQRGGWSPAESIRLKAQNGAITATTVAAVLDDLVRTVSPTWRGKSSETQWRGSITKHCAALWHLDVAAVTDEHVFQTLAPIWHEKAETASRILHRLERILDHARVLRLREGENPCTWARKRLGKQRRERKHYEAVPLAAIPDLMSRLGEDPSPAAAAFRLLVLTSLRSTEVLGLRWSEIDLEAGLLNLPATRMKAGVAFRVPLSAPATEILRSMPRKDEQLRLPEHGDGQAAVLADIHPTARALRRPRQAAWRQEHVRRLGGGSRNAARGHRRLARAPRRFGGHPRVRSRRFPDGSPRAPR